MNSPSGTGTNDVHGTVYDDWNGDGNYIEDWGLSGVPVELYEDFNGNGLPDEGLEPLMRTATDWWGNYSFLNVPNGDFVIVEVDPYGARSTNDVGGMPDDSMVGLTLSGWEIWSGVDFLDTDVDYSYVTGMVLSDSDASLTPTEGDDDIKDVRIDIYEDRNANGTVEAGELLLATTVTDSDGNYYFSWVPNRHYVVVETDPAAADSITDKDGTALNGPNAIGVLVDDASSTGNYFLDGSTLDITGQVRHDVDGDGDLGDDDEGVAGVKIELFEDVNWNGTYEPGVDIYLQTTFTDIRGNYAFRGLTRGDYLLRETDPDGATSTNDWEDWALEPEGTDNIIGTWINNKSNKNRDFLDTNVEVVTISGQVRHDADADGDLQDDDPGLAGVVVRLHTDPNGDGDPEDGVSIGSTATDLDGNYAFSTLIPGLYVVEELDPNGASSTNDASNGAMEPAGTDNLVAVALLLGDSTGIDFLDEGASRSSVSGTVRNDDDATDNNLIGAEDAPVGGVKVKLIADLNGNGKVDNREPRLGGVFSGSDGVYEFTNVVDGAYVIKEIDPDGAVSDFDVSGDPLDNCIAASVDGADVSGLDFLDDDLDTHAISGTVNSNVGPIANVLIILETGAGKRIDTAMTDSAGLYVFPNLVDGSYTVREVNPLGTSGGDDVDGGDPDAIAVEINGSDAPGNDFNDAIVALATISGTVFDDGPGNNNLFGPEDRPIAGVTVSLHLDADGNGTVGPEDTLLSSTITDSDGRYMFPSIPDDNYLVTETNPLYSLSDTDADGPGNGKNTIAVTIAGGVNSPGNDFLDDFVNLYTISGTVRDQDGDPLQAVIVSLRMPNGDLIEEAATADDGTYTFTGVTKGDYLVQETDPEGTTGGSDTDGSSNGDNTIAVTVEYSHQSGHDFTDTLTPADSFTISGEVRDDTDGDGDFADTEDRPVDGVEIVIYRDADGDGRLQEVEKVRTVKTNKHGKYNFPNLPKGRFYVLEIDPDGRTSSTGDPGTGDPNLIAVDLVDADSTGNDFLDAIDPAGYLYDSLTGEIIPGGLVEVTSYAFGNVKFAQDGSNGQYSWFVDSGDTYTMTVTPPAGYVIDTDRAPAAPSLDPTGLPDPTSLGAAEDFRNPGYLTDSSAAANPYYLVFDLAPGDPYILENNIPLRTLEARSWAQFVSDHGLSGLDAEPVPNASDLGGNPDGDSHSNLLEHALCLDPTTGADGHPGFRMNMADSATGRLDASFTRAKGISDVIYILEGRDSLTGDGADGQGWFTIASIVAGAPAAAPFAAVDNGDGTETITCPDVATASGLVGGAGLVRLRVALDADRNGFPDTLTIDAPPITDHTKTYGWKDSSCHAGQVASLSSPFLNEAVFSGTVDSISGLSVDVSTSAGGTDIRTVVTLGGNYYMQVTSGVLEGQRFDIGNVGMSNLVLVNDPDIFSDSDGVTSLNTSDGYPTNADLAGATIEVIPHRTLDQLFDKTGPLADEASHD
ncbi:MAG: hypothetical protein HKO57_00345, partial [Akkermansiaceae bacterium]|nr:hypothetical protein [Akkermansiaceae bacterium]